METTRVDICYRPLRIAWAIQSADHEAFRDAVRFTHTLWGGRFNPIVMVDRPEEAQAIVELFRADVIIPVGESEQVNEFAKRFPHLNTPFFANALKEMREDTSAHVLDIQNALAHWRGTSEWKGIDEKGIRRFVWEADDPLNDSLLLHYGAYPPANDSGIDYPGILCQASRVMDCRIEKGAAIPIDVLEHPSLGYLTRHGLRRHYTVRPGWDYAGFFVGDAANINDLVCFWNLRAADIQLQFVDPAHLDRYATVKPEYERRTLASLARFDEQHRRNLAVWSRAEIIEDALKLFDGPPLMACRTDKLFWRAGAVRPPMMMFGEASSLGIFSQEVDKPKVSFSLDDKPFCGESWFFTQRLVASVRLHGGGDQHTFGPPYVPKWNEFFARRMHFDYRKLRIEPERIGIIINATDHDCFLYGLSVPALMEKLFESIGVRAKLSGGGLITRQLISRLGGVDGARVFKIPGVRRLFKAYGPRHAFTKKAALELIGKKDPNTPQASFADHRRLFIEPRDFGTDLTPQMVFSYLVEKGLFRIGAELTCPTCNLSNWIALDTLKQENVCELCGSGFDATRQLVGGIFHYRRTGVLGLERNTQGAVPVSLVLQQLYINLRGIAHSAIYAPSYDLVPNAGIDLPSCEVDFVMILPRRDPNKAEIILGECKDEGGTIDSKDVENLRRIADALPANRFETYLVFAKLSPFTAEEIILARAANGPYQPRVILLTARELEPFDIYDRAKKEVGKDLRAGSPRDLAAATSQIYFSASQLAAPATEQ